MSIKKCRFMLPVILVLCMCFSCVSSPTAYLNNDEYAKLKSAAGSNYGIEYYENRIILMSKKAFYFYIAVSLPPMSDEEFTAYVKESGRQAPFIITLEFVPRWTKEKVDEARRFNYSINEKQYKLPEKYGLTHLMRTKQNSFFPETGDDEEKIKQYEEEYASLESQRIRIPEWNSTSYSIMADTNESGFEVAYSDEIPRLSLHEIFTRVE